MNSANLCAFGLALLITACATPGGRLIRTEEMSDKTQIFHFRNGTSCRKRADYTQYVKGTGAIAVRDLLKAGGAIENRMENAQKIRPKIQEIDAAFFDVCYEYGEERITREQYDEHRKFYELVRRRAIQRDSINISGSWICQKYCPAGGVGKQAWVRQEGQALQFINEGGGRSEGRFDSEDTVTATQWGVMGEIRQGGKEIYWSNGTIWSR